MSTQEYSSPETLAVHAGIDKGEYYPAVPPIYQTSTFAFDSAEQGAAMFAGKCEGFIYTRMGNPTTCALERALSALEHGNGALACSSGMSAIHTALAAYLKAGDHVVCSEAVYGPSCTLVSNFFPEYGIESTLVDTSDVAAVREAIKPNTKVVYVETPGNPTLVVSDLQAIAAIAHEHDCKLIVDNTFLSPVLQRPLDLGADVVVHSLTKFLNGHADVVGGAIVLRERSEYANMRRALNHYGGMLAPFDAFLVHRGLKTLPLRMERHCQSALKVAKWLETHEQVGWVRYPFLESHPQYEISKRQSTGGGAVISFELKGGVPAGRAVMNSVKLCMLAVSLGGVETLIQHPASMTHASMGADARRRAKIDDGMVRLSVGIESVDDIIADLDQAFEAAAHLESERAAEAVV